MKLVGGNDGQHANRWCILRTSSHCTLRLAASLNAAGFEAWTPQTIVSKRRPRSSKTVELELAIMPSFVFSRADRLLDLYEITGLPVSQHPAFSIFQHAGRAPIIADSQIVAIREVEQAQERDRAHRAALAYAKAEREAAAKSRRDQIALMRATAKAVSPGQLVSIEDGIWRGMEGTVVRNKGGRAIIDFGGQREINVASWLLLPIAVTGRSVPEIPAALAA